MKFTLIVFFINQVAYALKKVFLITIDLNCKQKKKVVVAMEVTKDRN